MSVDSAKEFIRHVLDAGKTLDGLTGDPAADLQSMVAQAKEKGYDFNIQELAEALGQVIAEIGKEGDMAALWRFCFSEPPSL